MDARPKYTNKYGRQVSDTAFYTNQNKGAHRQHGKRILSETTDHVRNGSVKTHHENNNGRHNIGKTASENTADSQNTHREHIGLSNVVVSTKPNHEGIDNRRTENVVRFHKDLVTDVHIDYRDKIQVDEIVPRHSPNKSIYKFEYDNLQHVPGDAKKQTIHKERRSSEQQKQQRQSSKKRKTSKEERGTELTTVNIQPTHSGIELSESKVTNGYIVQKPLNYQRTKEGKHRGRGSSKKRHSHEKAQTQVPIDKQNEPFKKPVKKTRSSSSTDSGHSATKVKRGDTYTLSVNELIDSSNKRNTSGRNRVLSLDKQTGKVESSSQGHKLDLSKKKKRKICCVFLSVVVTLLISAALVTGIVLFIINKGMLETGDDRARVYDMVNVHVRLRVLNHNYTMLYRDSLSTYFRNFSVQMCNEVDVLYITSHMSQSYYGCRVISLRSGSVQVYYVSPLLETVKTSNISQHMELLLTNLVTVSTPNMPANTTVLGDLHIDSSSIEISIERFKTNKLPPKPNMPVRVITTVLPTLSAGMKDKDSQSTSHKTTVDSTKVTSTCISEHTTKTIETTKSLLTQTMNSNKSVISTVDDSGQTDTTTLTTTSTTLPTEVTSELLDITTGTEMVTGTTITGTNATTIKEKVTDETVVVRVNGDNVTLEKEQARIECYITNSRDVISVSMTREDIKSSETVIKLFENEELTQERDHTSVLSRIRKLSIKFSPSSIYLRLQFTKVSCTDIGLYICKVRTKGEELIQAEGYLNGTAKPGIPQLSLPIALIENKETRKPIMCTADVGYPNGQILWKVKPKGSNQYLPFDGHLTSKSGQCDRYVTSSLIYTPTKDGNGTILKCEVINKFVPHLPDLNVVTDLYILPENFCSGVPLNKSIRHPSTCTKYIRCYGNHFEVKECQNKMCYDEESERCGKLQLTMDAVVAYLNEGVTSLQCRLNHLGVWNNITISKLLSNGLTQKIVTVKHGGTEMEVYTSDMKDRIFVHPESPQNFEIKINLWVYVLTCADEGLYLCEAHTPSKHQKVIARLDLLGKPDAPEINIPNEIIEGIPLRKNVTCQAHVGYPEGQLVLSMKFPNGTIIDSGLLNVTTESIIQNCSKLVKKSFTFTPTLNHERVKIVCEVENNYTLPINKKLIASETLHVIPKNFCLMHGSGTPQVHPHDCHQYVQCSEGYTYVQRCGSDYCFNPHTLHCDLEVKDAEEPFDPKHPCLPDKNGVFFHHPILCNKYIWCVQGHEVVHHCPLGTLYIDGGQCTFEPEKSRCYLKSKDTL